MNIKTNTIFIQYLPLTTLTSFQQQLIISSDLHISYKIMGSPWQSTLHRPTTKLAKAEMHNEKKDTKEPNWYFHYN